MQNSINNLYISFKNYYKSVRILTLALAHRQYKTSFLGNSWALVQPFLYLITLSTVFSFILKQDKEVLLLNLVASLSFWNFFSNSLTCAATSIIARNYIIKKTIISRSLFPVADVMMQVNNLIYAFIMMYLAFILFYPANFHLGIILLPIIALPFIVTIISISIALAYLTPFIRDIPQILTILLNTLYWTLPIIYPYDMVPANKKIFFEFNPLFILFRPIQVLVIENTLSLSLIVKSWSVTLIAALFSYFIYNKCRRNLVFYL